jgi:phage tail sheath gpL-like
MTIPVAVAPSVLTPGLYLSINLLAGTVSPGTGTLKVLLLAPISSGGDLTVDTEIRAGSGVDSASTAFGPGTLGHLAAKQLYAEFPNAVVDFGAPTAGAGNATNTIVVSGVPTANNSIRVWVHGRTFDVAWLVGETADDIRDKIYNGINQRTSDLMVVATNAIAGTVTITSKIAGNVGNDVKIKALLLSTQTGTEAVTQNTQTALAGGTTDPDYSTILAAAASEEYHFIVPCLSNTDAELTTSSSNAERTLTHIESHNSGLDAKLEQLVYASSLTAANASLAAIARNVGYAQHEFTLNGLSLPCEWAGAEAGSRLYYINLDPAANRIGVRLGGKGAALYGADDQIADKPTTAELETAIGNGVSINTYDTSGNIIAVRPVTTYSQDAGAAPDRRLLDTQNTDATYIIARDLRSALPQEFPNAKITPDVAPGADPPPTGVIEERDIYAFVLSRLRAWERQGVILKTALDDVVANGELVVQVNSTDPTQVDIVVPFSIVPPLAKFGTVVNRVPV